MKRFIVGILFSVAALIFSLGYFGRDAVLARLDYVPLSDTTTLVAGATMLILFVIILLSPVVIRNRKVKELRKRNAELQAIVDGRPMVKYGGTDISSGIV